MNQLQTDPTDRGSPSPRERRLLFVGGLHRSGTSLVHRCLTRHPEVSGFSGTGVPEDEGQHLQTVYPPAYAHGGPGRFGFDPDAHLTESSPLATAESGQQLLREWSPHWDPAARVAVEKSPPNLIRMRFLQALFPDCAFVMVLRHPAAVACATQKWALTRNLRNAVGRSTWTALIHHWVACHETMRSDSRQVGRVTIVRYEDFVRDPDGVLADIFSKVGLAPHPAGEEVRADINGRYFAAWRSNRNPVRVLDRSVAAARFETSVRGFGYSLRDLESLDRGPTAREQP